MFSSASSRCFGYWWTCESPVCGAARRLPRGLLVRYLVLALVRVSSPTRPLERRRAEGASRQIRVGFSVQLAACHRAAICCVLFQYRWLDPRTTQNGWR